MMFYFDILKKFYESNVKYLIVGGVAVNLYGIPRITQDIDIIIDTTRENILKINRIMKELDYIPKLPVNPNDLADPKKRKEWVEERNLVAFSFYHKQNTIKVVDMILSHPLDFESSFSNRTVRRARGIEVYTASIDDIIKMKETTGREQDKSDIEMLKEVKKFQE